MCSARRQEDRARAPIAVGTADPSTRRAGPGLLDGRPGERTVHRLGQLGQCFGGARVTQPGGLMPGPHRHPELAGAAPVRSFVFDASGGTLDLAYALAPAGGAVPGFPE